MEKGDKYRIVKLLKGHQLLAEEISDKLNMSEGKTLKYLNQMEYSGAIKSGITEDVPFVKVYRA